jgi:hypothetical protein
MRAREEGCTQEVSAAIADFSERSGRRIETGQHQPKGGQQRDWRTRRDPLSKVWEKELEPMLRREPRLEPTTLYEYLQDQYPGQYQSVLRTLQRRVQTWKVLHGTPKEVMFEIHHSPGEMGISDFTELKKVTVSIAGKPFEHLLYHYRLAYSGWEYVEVIQGGESFIGLSQGLQNALSACGGVPKHHRTDSLSAAYRNMPGKRHKPLTQFYDELCHHYRMRPTRNKTGIAHENGSIESPHGHFKHRLRQALYLRGNFDFESVSAYQAFITQVVGGLNARCTQKLDEEKVHLQPLPQCRFADYDELTVRVSCHSSIQVRRVLYTVPSRLVGQQLTIHLYHDRLVGYIGKQQVVQLERKRVPQGSQRRWARCINYRHIIEGLRRKPRAFLYCTWQSEILPNDPWRDVWRQLGERFEPDSAAKLMVEALYIAATQDKESAVETFLTAQIQQGTLTLAALQRHFQLLSESPALPTINVQQHSLSPYDELLDTPTPAPESLREPQSPPQTTPLVSHAQSLAIYRATGHFRTMVLCSILACFVRIGGSTTLSGTSPARPLRSATPPRKKFYNL